MVISRKLAIHSILVFSSTVLLMPSLFAVSTSFKSIDEIFAQSLNLVPQRATVEGWVKLIKLLPIGRWFFNSILVSLCGTIMNLFMCSLAAYAFARIEFPGRNLLYRFVVSTLMLPLAVYLVPLYLVCSRLHLLNSYTGMFIPVAESVYGVFLLTQFFRAIPTDLEAAALVDGCNRFDVFLRIMLPLSKPALVTLVIFTFLWKWNMFLWPLIIIGSRLKYPLTVGICVSVGNYMTDINMLMAGAAIISLPIIAIYVFFQRYIIGGIALSGLKG